MTFLIRYASTKLKEFLIVKKDDKAKLLVDDKLFEIPALTDSDTTSGTIILENITYAVTKDLAKAIVSCKSFEIKIKGSKNTSSGKLDDDDLVILKKFIRKYYVK